MNCFWIFFQFSNKNAYRETEKQSIWRIYDDDEFKMRFRFRPIFDQLRVVPGSSSAGQICQAARPRISINSIMGSPRARLHGSRRRRGTAVQAAGWRRDFALRCLAVCVGQGCIFTPRKFRRTKWPASERTTTNMVTITMTTKLLFTVFVSQELHVTSANQSQSFKIN